MFLSARCQFYAPTPPLTRPSPHSESHGPPVFLHIPSKIMMVIFSLFLLSGANQTANSPTLLSQTPLCSSPPPLEIIMEAAQWIGAKLWSLGRGCCHYFPILPCALRGGFCDFSRAKFGLKISSHRSFCSI